MASLQKNVASQFFTFVTVGSTSGAVTTSTSTSQFNSLAFLSTGTTQSSLAGTFTSLGSGQWAYAPTQGETNYVSVGYLFQPANTVPLNIHFFTDIVDGGGLQQVSVTNIGGVAASSSSTQLYVNVTAFGGTNVTGRDIGASVLVSSGTGTGQLAITSGVIQANVTQILSSAVNTSVAQVGANVVNFGGTAVTGRDIGASVLLSSGTGTGQVNLSSGNVVVATNNDKTGYTLTATAYSSFADVILDRDMSLGVDSGSSAVRTPRQALRVLRNKVDTSSGTTLVVYKEDDATTSWTASITVSSAAQPIVTLTPP